MVDPLKEVPTDDLILFLLESLSLPVQKEVDFEEVLRTVLKAVPEEEAESLEKPHRKPTNPVPFQQLNYPVPEPIKANLPQVKEKPAEEVKEKLTFTPREPVRETPIPRDTSRKGKNPVLKLEVPKESPLPEPEADTKKPPPDRETIPKIEHLQPPKRNAEIPKVEFPQREPERQEAPPTEGKPIKRREQDPSPSPRREAQAVPERPERKAPELRPQEREDRPVVFHKRPEVQKPQVVKEAPKPTEDGPTQQLHQAVPSDRKVQETPSVERPAEVPEKPPLPGRHQEVRQLSLRIEEVVLKFKLHKSNLTVEVRSPQEIQSQISLLESYRLYQSLQSIGVTLESFRVNGVELAPKVIRVVRRDRFNIREDGNPTEKANGSPSGSPDISLLL